MRVRRIKNLQGALLLGFLGAQVSGAKTYTVGPCEAKGGDARLGEVLCDLAQDAVVNLGHHVSVKGSEGIVKLKALRLGEAYTVTANLTVDDQIVSSSKLKAANADELDSIVPRLVRALLELEDVKKDAKVGEVTDDEQQFRKKRLTAKRDSILGFGAAGVANVNATKPYYNFVVGGSVDWTEFRLAGTLDVAWHAGERSGYFTSMSFAGNFFLSDRQSAPYIGPRIGLAWVSLAQDPGASSFGSDVNSTFLLGAVAGWEFFRNYEASFGIEFVVDYAFKEVGVGHDPVLFGLRAVVHR